MSDICYRQLSSAVLSNAPRLILSAVFGLRISSRHGGLGCFAAAHRYRTVNDGMSLIQPVYRGESEPGSSIEELILESPRS